MFGDWNQVFPNAGCVVTLVDRLLHRARIAQKLGARTLVDLLALGRLVDTRRPAGIPDARMRAAES